MLSRIRNLDTGRYSIFAILLAVIIVASILSPHFLTPVNATNVLRQVAVITILAYGAMMLIISGMIDLSAGAVMALAGVCSVLAFKASGSLLAALAVGILVGVVCNVINAFLVASLKTPAFIVTLGMMMAARGVVLQITNGQNVLQLGDFVKLGQGSLGWLPLPTLFLIVITVVVWYLMTQTRYGRSLYAVGGNEEAARAAGIAVARVKYQAFIVNGALVGFAGVIFMARVNAGLPNAGVGFELQAITAPIIGGTSFSGGVGTTAGTLAGALIVGVLGNIMNLTGIGSYIQQIVMGVIIAAAVAYDVWSKHRRGRGRTIILKANRGEPSSDVPAATAPADEPSDGPPSSSRTEVRPGIT
jgi:inositol transport system permease protein